MKEEEEEEEERTCSILGGPGFFPLSRHKVGKTAAIFLKACDDFALSAFNATLNFWRNPKP